jgi:hypothetical protein
VFAGVDDVASARLRAAVRSLAIVTRGRAPAGVSHGDADDLVGTVASDDAIGFDPFPLLAALHGAGAHAVVIGQVAGILHGSTELTGDLDLLWDGDRSRTHAFAAAFAQVRAVLSDDEGVVVPCTPEAFALPKVEFRSTGACGDCCTPALPWGDLPVAEFLDRHRTAVAADGTLIHYLDRDDLTRMRRAAGRPKDLRRADELQRLARAID